MAIVGYARVSTRDQDLAGQLAELKAAGCELVYREKVSGAASDRKELARLVRKLERGDTVIVTRLDRLARSTRDLLNILDEIGKAGAGFRSIKDTWADTTTFAWPADAARRYSAMSGFVIQSARIFSRTCTHCPRSVPSPRR